MMDPTVNNYYAIFNEASDGILLMDYKANLLDANRSMCIISGYSREELTKMNAAQLIDPEELKKDPISFQTVIDGQQMKRLRSLKKKDGTVLELDITVTRTADNMILVICKDMAELKKIQKTVELTESKFRTAFEYSAIGMMLVSTEGKFLKVNKKFTEITGYSEDELLQMTFSDITHPVDTANDLSYFKKALAGELKTYFIEKRYIHKKGRVLRINLNTSAVTDASNQVLYFVSQAEDVTEKKESELKFRYLLESSLTGVFIHQNGLLKYTNPRISEIFGYTAQELSDLPLTALIYDDDLDFMDEMIKRRVVQGDSTHYEARGRKTDGTVIWIEIFGSAIFHNGQPAFIGNLQDVTERKKTEAELKKMNSFNRERVKELNCLYRTSELINTTGKAMENILQEIAQIIPLSYQYPEITTARIIFNDRKFESANFRESKWKQDAPIKVNRETAGIVEVFYTSEMPESEEGPFQKEERFLISSIAEMVGTAAERKNAQATIKEQAETFQAIIENTKESIYFLSPDYKILIFNNTASTRMRLARGLELKTGSDFRNYLYPETTVLFFSMFEDSLKGIHRNEEISAIGTTGEKIWFQAKTSAVYNPQGEIIGVRLLTENIDERKHAEAALRESEEKFRSIVEQTLVGIYIIQRGKLIYVNPGFEKIFGYTKDQLLNKRTFKGLVHEEDISIVKKNYNSRISKRKASQQYFFRAKRSDGAILHLEVIASIITYNGQPAVIGTLIDNTDRIEEERRINQAVLDAQEKERLQIGMELHDNVKQILASSGMYLDIARNNINDRNTVTEILNDLKEQNSAAIDELRRLSHQLAPSVETSSELIDKIGWLIRSFKIDEKLSVSVHIDEFDIKPDNNIQLAFFRILQEQFSNILKYANASAIEINVRALGNDIQLQVKDNGRGFDLNKKKEGIGLENIRRRTQMLSGKVEIFSSPGKGCNINVLVPASSR